MKKKAKGDHSDDSLDGDIIEALDVALTLLDNQIELEAKDE